MNKRFKALLLFIALASSLIACGENPAPIIVTPPTVSITSPDTTIFAKSTVNFQLAVTGEPTTVELLKDGTVLASLTAPYTYTWDTSTETEKVYNITAKASKTGTADVVSAAREITVDRTAPTVTFQVPAANATGILLSNDIALTFSEVMLASSITDTSVKLEVDAFPNPYSLARTAALNSVGTKLTLKATHGGVYPIPVDILIAGVTDLAGNVAVVAKTSFTAVAPVVGGLPSVEVVAPQSPIDNKTFKFDLTVFAKNFSGSRVTSATIYLNGKFFDFSNTPSSCPGSCFKFQRGDLTSYYNGNYDVTAMVRQEDGTETKTTVGVPLVIGIKNFDGSPGLGWSPAGIGGIPRPTFFNNFNNIYYAPDFGQFYSVNTGIGGATILEISKQYSYALTPRSQTSGFYFKARIGTTSVNDTIQVFARDCKNAQECTVWNIKIIDSSNPQNTEINIGPPNFGDTASEAAYMEIMLRFNSENPQSKAYIGSIFVGTY
jgi:Bacterial Ig-like domain/Bacterial Ig domain